MYENSQSCTGTHSSADRSGSVLGTKLMNAGDTRSTCVCVFAHLISHSFSNHICLCESGLRWFARHDNAAYGRPLCTRTWTQCTYHSLAYVEYDICSILVSFVRIKFIAQTIKIPKIRCIYRWIAPVHTIIAKLLLFDLFGAIQKWSPNEHRSAHTTHQSIAECVPDTSYGSCER